VVDVVDSHKAIDGIGIVVVQPFQVTRSERSSVDLGVCHGDSPFRFFEVWKFDLGDLNASHVADLFAGRRD
jgi:hypothetical protein